MIGVFAGWETDLFLLSHDARCVSWLEMCWRDALGDHQGEMRWDVMGEQQRDGAGNSIAEEGADGDETLDGSAGPV